jgi:hypothetical protein
MCPRFHLRMTPLSDVKIAGLMLILLCAGSKMGINGYAHSAAISIKQRAIIIQQLNKTGIEQIMMIGPSSAVVQSISLLITNI